LEEKAMAEFFIGEIRIFGGSFAPDGWVDCDGQLLSCATYPGLFSLIGTTYGGDGNINFAVPDLRGRVPIHRSNTSPVGDFGGKESVILTTDQIPIHTHSVKASSNTGNQNSPEKSIWSADPAGRYSTGTPNQTMKSTAVGGTGQNHPHNNMMPFVGLRFIIAYIGEFPSVL
jgi:microcystin-dependent protein